VAADAPGEVVEPAVVHVPPPPVHACGQPHRLVGVRRAALRLPDLRPGVADSTPGPHPRGSRSRAEEILVKRAVLTGLAGVALLLVPAVAAAQESPLVELCAATGVDEVDEVLAELATSELVGELAGLVELTVPLDADSTALAADVELDDVRTALDCGAPTTTPTAPPTTTPPVTTSSAPAPDPDEDDDDFDQVGRPPVGGVATGG
jgi:hypothetical protein